MKRKILVSLAALILCASLVGTCFALYTQNASTKRITIGTGDFVALSIGTVSAGFDLEGLSPSHNVTLNLSLNASNTNLAEENVQGKFTVALSGEVASHVTVTAAGTYYGGGEFSATNSELTTGKNIALADIPTAITLTFAMDAITAETAEQEIGVTLSWIFDATTKFTPREDTYYLVGTIGGVTAWYPVSAAMALSVDDLSGNNIAQKVNFAFSAGDEFKVVKGNDTNWYSCGGACTGCEILYGGNCKINTAGSYTVYLSNDGSFYMAVGA